MTGAKTRTYNGVQTTFLNKRAIGFKMLRTRKRHGADSTPPMYVYTGTSSRSVSPMKVWLMRLRQRHTYTRRNTMTAPTPPRT